MILRSDTRIVVLRQCRVAYSRRSCIASSSVPVQHHAGYLVPIIQDIQDGASFLPAYYGVLAALSLPPNTSPRTPYTRGAATSRISPTPVPPATVRALAITHNISGLLFVGENIGESFRFLRVDHTLLGGRWIGKQGSCSGI